MSSRRGQVALRQAVHHVRSMPFNSAPGTMDAYQLVVLGALPPFIECVPANITWTGGLAPYSLRVTLAGSMAVLRGFDGISATNFVWAPDVPAGTKVSLELMDAGTPNFVFTQDLITIAAGPDGASSSCMAPSTSIQQVAATSIIPSSQVSHGASSVASANQAQTSTSLPSMQAVPQNKAVNGRMIAVVVVGVVIFLLLAGVLLWRSRMTARRRKRRSAIDAEKQDTVNERPPDGKPEELRSDAGSTGGHSIGPSSRPEPLPTNPFEDPENVRYTEEIFTASPVLDADNQLPTPAQYSFVGALPSSPRPVANVFAFAPTPLGPRRPKVPPRSRSRPLSISAQSDASARTSTLSDANAARLSISTSSTLPPSYRTRRSAGSIYIPPQGYPPFPPPVYTLQPTDTPSSASRTRRIPPKRVPPRRRPVPTPPKVSGSQSARSSSREREPAHADVTRRGLTRIRDTDRVEGSGAEEVDSDADAISDPFSDSRRGSLDSPLAGTGSDAITNRVYAEDVGVNERGGDRVVPAADSERT